MFSLADDTEIQAKRSKTNVTYLMEKAKLDKELKEELNVRKEEMQLEKAKFEWEKKTTKAWHWNAECQFDVDYYAETSGQIEQ